MKKSILLIAGLAFLTINNQAQTVTDIDGNVYNTVTIGAQVWLQENLKVIHYNNGDEIPNVSSSTAWLGLSTGAYCNYENNAGFVITYGSLYNWFAVNDSRCICPTGWHVATDEEWTILTDLLGGEAVAGGKLKEAGTLHWPSPNTGATNEVGFTALGGGYRSNTATYIGFGGIGSWWCSTESSTTDAWGRGVFNDAINVDRGGYYEKMMGFSVRCIKDETTSINDMNLKNDIKFFPNPAKERIYLNNSENQIILVKVYNLVGECVLKKNIIDSKTEININSLLKGLYIIELTSENCAVQSKLIKE